MTTLKTGVLHIEIKPPKHRSCRRLMRWMWKLKPFDFIIPDDLLLITSHNKEKTFFEEQMEHHNVSPEAYTLIKHKEDDPEVGVGSGSGNWSNFLRWKRLLDHIKSKEAEDKKYVMFCDATDNFFIDSPHNILHNFKEYFHCSCRTGWLDENRCDLLYNGTGYRGMERGGKMDPQHLRHHKAKELMHGRSCNLNAGLFIGRKDFVIEVYEKMLTYELDSLGNRNESSWRTNPEFPYGCTSDQQVLRYIYPKFFPRMLVDYQRLLFIRWSNLSQLWACGRIPREMFSHGATGKGNDQVRFEDAP